MNGAACFVGRFLQARWLRRLQWVAGPLLLCLSAVQAAPPVFTLAVSDSPHTAPVLIAESLGYFAAEGLSLKIIHCVIGRRCLKHLLDGQAHVATVAETPITIAGFTRRDFAVIATTTTTGGRAHQMVVRSDRGIRSVADLKGKRIGVLRGTSAHYFADTLLLLHGIAVADTTLVWLEPEDATGPVARGEVDAAALFEPQGSKALRKLGPLGFALPTPSAFTTTFNLVSVPAAAGASDDDLRKLLRAVQRGVELIHKEPERARAIVGASLETDPQALLEAWQGLEFRVQLAQALVTTLEAQARWAKREKLVPADAPEPDFLDLVRTEPLRQLDARAVRLVR